MPTEKIVIQIDDQVIQLTGADREAFLEQRSKDQAEAHALELKFQEQRELKKSAYTKLGLTEEEINAIL
jgi:hypothetical protein